MGGLHWLDVVTLGLYLTGILFAGLWAARRVKGVSDFFMGGRSFGKAFMIMHAFGTGTQTDQAVSVSGAAYKLGMAGIWYQWAYLFVTPFYWLIAPLYRRMRYVTLADFYERRFGESLAILYTLFGIFYFILIIGILLLGTGKTASAMTDGQISSELAIAVMSVLFLSYGLAGGLPAAVFTDFIQGFFVIVLSFLLVPFLLNAIGGFEGLHRAIPAEMFSLTAPGDPPPGYDRMTPFYITMIVINTLVGIAAAPSLMEQCGAGKTEQEGRVGFTYGNLIKRLCTVAWAFTGVICIALFPGLADPEHAFGTAARDLLPIGLIGVMLASMTAAAMSTCDSYMVNASALFVRNVYQAYLRPEATDRHYLTVGRLVSLCVVAGGILVAAFAESVVGILVVTWASLAFFGVAFWGGILWRRCNLWGAWAGILVSGGLWYVARFEWHWELAEQFLLMLSGGFISLVLVSLLTPPTDAVKLDHFYTLIHTPVGQEDKLRDAGIEIVLA